MLREEDIDIYDNWIHVKHARVGGSAQIGLYSPSDKAILLDYSMKWLVGTNERIPCDKSEIKEKILNLFNNETNKPISSTSATNGADGL